MQRSRSPASSCCTAFGRDSSNCDVSAFKIELHLQSGTQCFEPEPALRSKDCLLVLVICTRAIIRPRLPEMMLQEALGLALEIERGLDPELRHLAGGRRPDTVKLPDRQHLDERRPHFR